MLPKAPVSLQSCMICLEPYLGRSKLPPRSTSEVSGWPPGPPLSPPRCAGIPRNVLLSYTSVSQATCLPGLWKLEGSHCVSVCARVPGVRGSEGRGEAKAAHAAPEGPARSKGRGTETIPSEWRRLLKEQSSPRSPEPVAAVGVTPGDVRLLGGPRIYYSSEQFPSPVL